MWSKGAIKVLQSELDSDDQEEDDEAKFHATSGTAERHFHPEELKQLIPLFKEGSGVLGWLQIIDHYRQLYAWSSNSTLLYASCRLGGAAYQWYLGVRQQIRSWKEFKAGICVAFPEYEDEADVHRRLARWVKDVKESYDNYVFRVNAIGQNGNLSSSAIIKYVISGLSYDPLYSSVAIRRYETIYELLEQIRYCESNQEMCKRRNYTYTAKGNTPKSTKYDQPRKPKAARRKSFE